MVTAPNGYIFVADGHGRDTNARIVKFSRDGKFIKTWGRKGAGPGEIDIPHAIAMDSQGRLFVGDRNNNRIQIFDQDGNFLDQWFQFSWPSGVFIDRNDAIYVADPESESVARNHDGWRRGIRIGSARTGAVTAFIPDPVAKITGTSAAEGVAADAVGNRMCGLAAMAAGSLCGLLRLPCIVTADFAGRRNLDLSARPARRGKREVLEWCGA